MSGNNIWVYNGKPVTELPSYVYGFIYLIHYTNGQKYVGKKKIISEITKPALKSGKIREGAKRIGKNKNGKRVYYDIVTKQNNWREYEGSSMETSGLEISKKEILHLVSNKRTLTYLEMVEQVKRDVLFNDEYLNLNIGGLYYDNALDGYIKDLYGNTDI